MKKGIEVNLNQVYLNQVRLSISFTKDSPDFLFFDATREQSPDWRTGAHPKRDQTLEKRFD